jgi:hypothetical protein
MFHRLRWASVAFLAVLAVAPPCLAAGGMGPGRGGIGGQLGGSLFWADGDYSEGAKARFAFSGHFRYVFSDHFRWQISPGFTWAGYTNQIMTPVADSSDPNFPAIGPKKSNLTLLLPMTFQVQYLVNRGRWHYHAGVGPGVYRVWIENRRRVLVDPVSFKLHRGLYPGVTGEIGFERFMKVLPSTSLELTVATHWVFAERDEQFPMGYNSFLAATEVRLGGNFYFDISKVRRAEKEKLPVGRK